MRAFLIVGLIIVKVRIEQGISKPFNTIVEHYSSHCYREHISPVGIVYENAMAFY